MMRTAPLARRASNAALVVGILAFAVFGLGPQSGAYRTLSILSDSMEPTFSAGDSIVVTPIPSSRVRAGDVITYHAPVDGRPIVTHRVVEVVRRGERPVVRTKGDSNEAADPWQARLEKGTVWRHRATIPLAGHLIRGLRHEAVRPLTIYALPLILVLTLLVSIWRQPTGHRRLDDASPEVARGPDQAVESTDATERAA